MNRKQFVILAVLVVAVGGLGYHFYNRNAESYQTSGGGIGKKLLGEFPINDVAQILIRSNQTDLNLVKSNDVWLVRERGGYPANYSEIRDLVSKLAELKIVQVETIGPSQLSRMELAEPGHGPGSGTLLELKDASGKPIKSVLLGKKHLRKTGQPSPMGDEGGFPDGRFVQVKGAGDQVALISDPLASAEPRPETWLDKDFFKVEKARTISFTATNATNSWKIQRESETAEWKLIDPKAGEQPLDAGKASSAGTAFNSPSFADVAIDLKPEVTGLDKPSVVVIESFDHLTYTLRVGNKSGEENFYLSMSVEGAPAAARIPGKDEKPEDKTRLDQEFQVQAKAAQEKLKKEKAFEKWTYLVPKWSVEPLVRDRYMLLADKKEEPKPDAGALPTTFDPLKLPLPPGDAAK